MNPDPEMTTEFLLTNFDANLRAALTIFPKILMLTFIFAMAVWGARKIARMNWTEHTHQREHTEEAPRAAWTTPNEVRAQSTSTAADADLERLRQTVEKGSL